MGWQVRLRGDHNQPKHYFGRTLRSLNGLQGAHVGPKGRRIAKGTEHPFGVPPPAQHRRLLPVLSQDGQWLEPLEHYGEHAVEA